MSILYESKLKSLKDKIIEQESKTKEFGEKTVKVAVPKGRRKVKINKINK